MRDGERKINSMREENTFSCVSPDRTRSRDRKKHESETGLSMARYLRREATAKYDSHVQELNDYGRFWCATREQLEKAPLAQNGNARPRGLPTVSKASSRMIIRVPFVTSSTAIAPGAFSYAAFPMAPLMQMSPRSSEADHYLTSIFAPTSVPAPSPSSVQPMPGHSLTTSRRTTCT